MSLQSNVHKETETAVRLRAGNFAFVVRRVIAPLLLQMTRDRQARRVADNRRKAAQEIDALPASLHQDIAFSRAL
jgi:hypothetical protein